MISRKTMVDFLTSHFRYNTMNSWNQSTSYAANVKIHKWVPCQFADISYNLLETEGAYEEIREIMADWDREQDWIYQVGFNGRSSGYIVMYLGGYEIQTLYPFQSTDPDTKQDYSDAFGWVTHADAKARGLVNFKHRRIFTRPGQSIDQGDDFSEWTLDSIRSRYALVRSFDKMVERCKRSWLDLCKNYTVGTEEYQVTKTRKVLIPV